MAATIQDLLRERKYPFLSSFFVVLFVFFLAVLLITSNRYTTDEHNRPYSIASSTMSSSFPPFQRSNDVSSPIQKPKPAVDFNSNAPSSSSSSSPHLNSSNGKNNIENIEIQWKVCGGVLASDYIPCLDNMKAIKALTTRRHMEHRERHCPKPSPRCLTPLPRGYKLPVLWPKSRDMIWYDNVPHPKLVDYKKGQNWVQRSGDYFVFPGGGTQFKDGVIKYVEFIEETLTTIKWGQHTRVILDVGCGVASFGGYLLDKGVITMSFAPKDEHEAQIQFALERGIPATLSVIGTQRLTFPDNAYDLIHCARCRVHWDANGGKPLLELNRILRPGGLFVWSATPVYRDDKRDLSVWNAMVALTESICWKAVAKTVDSSGIGLVIYQKPVSNACYEGRKENVPPLCEQKDNHNASWYVPLGSCLHKLSSKELDWPAPWPERLISKPPNLAMEPEALKIYYEDTKHWSVFVSEVYMGGLSVNWSGIRNVMDMNAGYGGFAAAVVDKPVWVMNVVPPPTSVEEEDSLGVIFDRGLIGIYHDWCESFNTYPRTYDLLHANYLFRNLRCEIVDVAVEMDRILRPGGWVLVRDNNMDTINKLTSLLHSLHWETSFYHPQNHLLLVARKTLWRPNPIPTTTTHHRRS